MAPTFQVLLYYRYVHIPDPEAFAAAQRLLCARLGLKGRIIIAREGINGTVSGELDATEEYIQAMRAEPLMAGIGFKVDPAEGHAFPKMSIKVRSEVVSLELGAGDLDPNQVTGERLAPADFYAAMQQEGAIVLDARNNYESDLGHFKGAICPDLDNFRDFPGWIRENLGDAKDKPVLTYCTGGIRCEKLSGFLKQEGFESVAQLEGGIVSYGKDEAVQGRDFDGQCYVFDQRIAVPVNSANPEILARCRHCGEPSERYVNCRLQDCNAQIFVCEGCEEAKGCFCGSECRQAADAAMT